MRRRVHTVHSFCMLIHGTISPLLTRWMKKLSLPRGARTNNEAETETLGYIRHANIVKLFWRISSSDFGVVLLELTTGRRATGATGIQAGTNLHGNKTIIKL
nr:unnamed protein product [Digitaria exilis]